MKPFTGRYARATDVARSFQFVERHLRAALDKHALAAQLAFEKSHVAVPVPANAVLGPAVRAPSVEHVPLGRVEVQGARPIFVTEGTGAMRIRVKKGACPLTNPFTHLQIYNELNFEGLRSRLFGVDHRITESTRHAFVTPVKKR